MIVMGVWRKVFEQLVGSCSSCEHAFWKLFYFALLLNCWCRDGNFFCRAVKTWKRVVVKNLLEEQFVSYSKKQFLKAYYISVI